MVNSSTFFSKIVDNKPDFFEVFTMGLSSKRIKSFDPSQTLKTSSISDFRVSSRFFSFAVGSSQARLTNSLSLPQSLL